MSTSIVLWVGALGLPGVEAVPVMVVALGLCSTVAVALCQLGHSVVPVDRKGIAGQRPRRARAGPRHRLGHLLGLRRQGPRRGPGQEAEIVGRGCERRGPMLFDMVGDRDEDRRLFGPGCSTRRPSLTAR